VSAVLPGEFADRLHDLVGDDPARLSGAATIVRCREVQRPAEFHDDAVKTGQPPGQRAEVGRCRSTPPARRDSGLQDKPGDPRPAAIEPAIDGAGSLGVDAEGTPLGQHSFSEFQRYLRTAVATPLNGYASEGGENSAPGRPSDPYP
jgi:hypothetical protein